MPAPGLYCIKCGPPEIPELDPEKGLDFSQTCLRIALIILVFLIVAVFKLDISSTNLLPDQNASELPLKVAKDEDYHMIFKVNVGFANLRDQPNSETSTIMFVLAQGTQVEVLEKKGKWSRVRSKPGPGKKARTGWLASRLLDSEIK